MIDDVVVSGERPMDERLQLAVRPPSPVKALFTAWGNETDLTPPSLKRGRGAAALRVGSLFSRSIYRGLNKANQVDSAASSAGPAPPGPLDEVIEHFRWLHDIAPPTGPSPLDDALIALTAVGDTGTALRSAAGLADPGLTRDKQAAAMAKLHSTEAAVTATRTAVPARGSRSRTARTIFSCSPRLLV